MQCQEIFKENGSIKPDFNPQTRIVSDKLENLITKEKQIVNYFKEYFNQLKNQPVIDGDNEIIYFYTTEPKIEKPLQK